MDPLERNIALALMLGRLEAALAVVQGIEHKVFGVTEEDRHALAPKIQQADLALKEAIQTVAKLVPEGERITRRSN